VISTQDDGTTTVADYLYGYQFVLPTDWVTLNLETGDLEEIIDYAAKTNPELADNLTQAKKFFTSGARLVALDTNLDHKSGISLPVLIVMTNDLGEGFPVEFILGIMEESLPNSFPQAKILSSGVIQSKLGIQIGQIDLNIPLKDPNGKTIQFFQRTVFFKGKDTLMMVTLIAPNELRTTITPTFDEIVNSIGAIAP